MGAPPEVLAQARANAHRAELVILPCNLDTVQAFWALGTQWRIAYGMQRIGLDYPAIPIVLRLHGIPRARWPEIFDGLRVMEHAALKTR